MIGFIKCSILLNLKVAVLESEKEKLIKPNKFMNEIELKTTEQKDHSRLLINGVDVTGEQERSVFRHIIETIDNGIGVELNNNHKK